MGSFLIIFYLALITQLCDIISGKNAEEEHCCAADERDAQAVP